MVSLGPGDSELLTLKALKTLQDSHAICVPTKCDNLTFERSLTHKIVCDAVELSNIAIVPVYAPMKFKKEDWVAQADTILDTLKQHAVVSFVTLGDAAVYSTVYYLLEIIKQKEPHVFENTEVIPGVTSYSQASAKVKKPLCLGRSALEIVPIGSESPTKTTVYMRPRIGAGTENIIADQDFVTFEDLNFKGEKITYNKIPTIKRYMTLLINFIKVKF